MLPFRPALFVGAFLVLFVLSTWGRGPVTILAGLGSLALYSVWLFQCRLVLKAQAESVGRQTRQIDRAKQMLFAAAGCELGALVASLAVRPIGQVIGAFGAVFLILAIWNVAMDLRDAEAKQQRKLYTELGTFLSFCFAIFGAWEVRRRLRNVMPAGASHPPVDLVSPSVDRIS
jgi:hypothetical protein